MLTLDQVRAARKDRRLIFGDHAEERLQENGISEEDVFRGLDHPIFQKSKTEEEKGTHSEMLVIRWKKDGRDFTSVFSRQPNMSVVKVVTTHEHNQNHYRQLKQRKDFSMAANLPVVTAPQETPEQTKRCAHCHLEKPHAEFYKNSALPGKLNAICKVCSQESARASAARRKERVEGMQEMTTRTGPVTVTITVTDPDIKSFVEGLVRSAGYETVNDRPNSFAIEVEKQFSFRPRSKQETA